MTGILIILGIVLAVAVGGFLLHAAFHRFGRSRQRAMERHPAPDPAPPPDDPVPQI